MPLLKGRSSGGAMNSVGLAAMVLLVLAPGCALLIEERPRRPALLQPQAAAPSRPNVAADATGLSSKLRLGRVTPTRTSRIRSFTAIRPSRSGIRGPRLDREARSVCPAGPGPRSVRRARREAAPLGRGRDIGRRHRRVRRGARAGARGPDRARLCGLRRSRRPALAIGRRGASHPRGEGSAAANEAVQAMSEALVAAVDAVADAATSELRAEEASATKSSQSSQ